MEKTENRAELCHGANLVNIQETGQSADFLKPDLLHNELFYPYEHCNHFHVCLQSPQCPVTSTND